MTAISMTDSMTDLTPKSSTPWWSILDCCRLPPPPPSSGVEKDVHTSNEDITAIAPSVKVVRWSNVVGQAMPLPDNPAQNDDLPRERAVTFEDDEGFIGTVENPGPQCPNKMSSTENSAGMEEKCGDGSNTGEATSSYTQLSSPDEKQLPEIEATKQQTNKPEQDPLEMKFYQFMLLMMLRHVFGSWLPQLDLAKKNLFLTQYGSKSKKKEFHKMMTLRTLQLKGKNACEAVPQLKREY